jgi:anti-sigma regulatory factor (Ser/Thr protein kinase)
MSGSAHVAQASPASRPGVASWPLGSYLELAALPTAVPCARLHAKSIAVEWGLPELADTAELLVSELMTNALQASAGLRIRETPVVRLWLASDRISMVIRVWDGSQEMPVRQQADLGDDSGRGLMIIDELSADWGSYPDADGKIVWARAALPS